MTQKIVIVWVLVIMFANITYSVFTEGKEKVNQYANEGLGIF